jgi:peroxiredoxin Q/BCP
MSSLEETQPMKPAPNFSLPDQTGTVHTLADYAGSWLVLYFYPEDDTPGCTIEACAFRDDLPDLEKQGLRIVGVSGDSVASHAKFAEKYHLNFTLLADESKSTLEAYGAWGEKKTLGMSHVGSTRKTFLINPAGEIAKEYPKVTPLGHSKAILRDYTALKET